MPNLKLFSIDYWARKIATRATATANANRRALATIVNSGNKNYLPFTAPISTGSGSYIMNKTAVTMPAGEYVIYMEKDFDSYVSINLRNGNDTIYSVGTWAANRTKTALRFKIDTPANNFSLWAGTNKTVNALMICRAEFWDITPNFEPWRGQPVEPTTATNAVMLTDI